MPAPDEIGDLLQDGLLRFDADRRIVASSQPLHGLIEVVPRPGMEVTELIAEMGPGAEVLADLRAGNQVVAVCAGRLLECTSHALTAGELWVVRDVSELVRLQAQVAEQGHILASGSEAYLVVDPQGLVRYANAFCEEERGYVRGEMVGHHLVEFERQRNPDGSDGPAISRDELTQRLRRCLEAGGVHRYDSWHYRKDGTRFPTEVSVRPYRLQQDTVLLLTARDESERLNFVRELMAARAKAEESSRAKSAFLAVTSHELRTPLTAVIGFCDLLRLDHGAGDNDLARYLNLIHKSSTSLLRLINDIIDFAKLEGKTLHFQIHPIQVVGFVAEVEERWRDRFAHKQLTLTVAPQTDSIETIYADPGRVNQILDNLIGNAWKFTQQGGVRLAVSALADGLRFEIADTGPGIGFAARDRVFEPFFQEADSTTRKQEGTGLGLYISRSLAQQLGGDIELLSTGPEGTRFALTLPLRLH